MMISGNALKYFYIIFFRYIFTFFFSDRRLEKTYRDPCEICQKTQSNMCGTIITMIKRADFHQITDYNWNLVLRKAGDVFLFCTRVLIWSQCLKARVFPHGSDNKDLPAVQETWLGSLSREEPLVKGMATHFSILAWRIPWTEKPGRLHPWGGKESDMTE